VTISLQGSIKSGPDVVRLSIGIEDIAVDLQQALAG
jgi:O-acetylhomoserine/O-acetylserine sulfhydrylase-like pyridoxal-dependent enzyme